MSSDLADFRAGLHGLLPDGRRASTVGDNSQRRIEAAAGFAAAVSRLCLFGFLLARPGVPFLPWGDATAVGVTMVLAAAAVSTRYRSDDTLRQSAALAVVLGALMLISRTDLASTSMVAVGGFIVVITSLVQSFPQVYGFLAGVAAFAVALQVFDWEPFGGGELILSGRPWSPDAAGHETLLVVAAVFIAALLHLSRAEWERQEKRADAAELARDRAVSDERARIARELHDVVSHHVTAMTLQAEAAAATGDRGALAAVATNGREALAELRRMLGVLRRPSTEADEESRPALTPQPDLSMVDKLAQRAGAAVAVDVRRAGDVVALPAGVELCAYRIVQEALTNVGKHSDARRATVTLTYEPEHLTVEVVDDGNRLQDPRMDGGGHGIVGMQERVALVDGELAAGPRPEGGWRVLARLPLGR